jgi:hypothetical protein
VTSAPRYVAERFAWPSVEAEYERIVASVVGG